MAEPSIIMPEHVNFISGDSDGKVVFIVGLG